MSRACARRKARRSSPTGSPKTSDILVENLEAQGRHRLCDVEHAGIRRRRQYLQRSLRAHAQSVESVALGGGLVGRCGGGARHRHGLGGAWLRHGRIACAIRQASAASSACGLRPGGWPSTSGSKIDGTLGVDGPMARNVEDLALLFDAMVGRESGRSLVAAARGHLLSARPRFGWKPKRVALSAAISASRRSIRKSPSIVMAAAQALRRGGRHRRGGASRSFAKRMNVSRRCARSPSRRASSRCSINHRDKLKPEVDLEYREGAGAHRRRDRHAPRRSARRCSSACVRFFDSMICCCVPRRSWRPFRSSSAMSTECDGHKFENYVDWLAIAYAITNVASPGDLDPGRFHGEELAGRHPARGALPR